MAGWFDLGETLYFDSQMRCTAAIYRVKSGDVKSRVPHFDSVAAVVASDRLQKPFAISVRGKTADALFIDLMNADRPTGVAIQAAGINARDCMNERARNTFHAALNADPSTVVFSVSETAFAVLDPVRGVVMLTSGGRVMPACTPAQLRNSSRRIGILSIEREISRTFQAGVCADTPHRPCPTAPA